MDIVFNFRCLRCGNCCTNLVKEFPNGIHLGLNLFPEERIHFSNTRILPSYGVGSFPEDIDFRIYIYQLDTNVCPHFVKTKNQAVCRIYGERPLVCRMYPLEPTSLDEYGRLTAGIDPGCQAVQEYRKMNPDLKEVDAPEEEETAREILSRVGKHSRYFGGVIWGFDIRTKEWIPLSSISL